MSQPNSTPPVVTPHAELSTNNDPPLQSKSSVDPSMTADVLASLTGDEDLAGEAMPSKIVDQQGQQRSLGQEEAPKAHGGEQREPGSVEVPAAAPVTPEPAKASEPQTGSSTVDLANDFLNALKPKDQGQESSKKPTLQPQVQPAVQQTPDRRDYSGLPAEDVEVFKQMSNTAYAKLRPVYDEARQLKQTVEEQKTKLSELQTKTATVDNFKTWADHPEAFQLTPEYKQAQQTFELVDSVEQHWKNQLIKIKNKEEWQELVRNDKGQFIVVDQPRVADARSELYVQEQMQNAARVKDQVLRQAIQQEQDFKRGYQDTTKFIREGIEKRFFRNFEPDRINLPEMAKHKQTYEDIFNAWPETFRNQMAAPLLAKSFALIIDLGRILAEKDKAGTVQDLKQRDAKLVQPAGNAVPVSAVTKGQSTGTVTIDDFKNLMHDPDLN